MDDCSQTVRPLIHTVFSHYSYSIHCYHNYNYCVKKIAVVNDDADFLSAMESLLKEFGGYDAYIIHEGNLAYKQIKKEQPSLVILDIRMDSPTTGWKVLDLLTLDPDTNRIPVIICTASTKLPDGKEEWLKEHGISMLPKPFDVNDLIAMVERSLKPRKQNILLKTKVPN